MPLLNAYVGVAVLFAVIIYGFEVCMMIREWYYLRNTRLPHHVCRLFDGDRV